MKLHLDGDLVTGAGTGDFDGPPAPDALLGLTPSALAAALDRLRFVDGALVDVSARTAWFIDGLGRKHVEAADGRQPLTCALGDAILPGPDGTWAVFVPPPAVPDAVWDWQFAGQAADEGIITAQEALDWCGGGHVPASLITAVDKAVADPARHAKVVLFLTGASQFPRAHPLVPVLAAAFGKDTPELVDAFFVAAGAR